EPWLLDARPDYLRWTVLGSVTALAAILAIVATILRSPSRHVAALELDGRYGLRERVTTVLGLPANDLATSAGQAVLTDTVEKISAVKVSEKFPVRPRRSSLLVPAFAALLAL